VSCGKAHTLALDSQGVVYSWGDGSLGQLGTGDFYNKDAPVKISINALSVSAGFLHSVILNKNHSISVFGDNYYGQLGNGITDKKPVNKLIKLTKSWLKVGVGENFTITLDSKNVVYGVGSGASGQLGYDNNANPHGNYALYPLTDSNINDPAINPNLDGWKDLAAGYVTGQNTYGQATAPTGTDKTLFTLAGGVVFKNIFAGVDYWFGLTDTGVLYGIGRNSNRQLSLGNNVNTDILLPCTAPTIGVWSKVACAYKHTLALSTNGDIYVTGSAAQATTFGTSKASFTQIGLAGGWTDISAGRTHSLGIRNGKVYAWGDNLYGECSDVIPVTGTSIITEIMTAITLNSTPLSVHAGTYVSYVLMTNGAVYSFGSNVVYNTVLDATPLSCGKLGRIITGDFDAVPTTIIVMGI